MKDSFVNVKSICGCVDFLLMPLVLPPMGQNARRLRRLAFLKGFSSVASPTRSLRNRGKTLFLFSGTRPKADVPLRMPEYLPQKIEKILCGAKIGVARGVFRRCRRNTPLEPVFNNHETGKTQPRYSVMLSVFIKANQKSQFL